MAAAHPTRAAVAGSPVGTVDVRRPQPPREPDGTRAAPRGGRGRTAWPSCSATARRVVAAMLAALKAGLAYVPLDPLLPAAAARVHPARRPRPGVLLTERAPRPGPGAGGSRPRHRGGRLRRRRPEPGEPGPGRAPGRPRLPALHLGLDRKAQGGLTVAQGPRELLLRGHRPLRRHGARTGCCSSRPSTSTRTSRSYPSLMAGATLHLRDDEMISSTGHFSRWTKQRRITLPICPPPTGTNGCASFPRPERPSTRGCRGSSWVASRRRPPRTPRG